MWLFLQVTTEEIYPTQQDLGFFSLTVKYISTRVKEKKQGIIRS